MKTVRGRLSLAFLISSVCWPNLVRAQMASTPGEAGGGSFSPAAVSGYASSLGGLFASQRPDLMTLQPMLAALKTADLGDPRTREALTPVYTAVQAQTQALQAGAAPAPGSPADPALAAKFVALRALQEFQLPETRAEVARRARAYHGSLPGAEQEKLRAELAALHMQSIIRELGQTSMDSAPPVIAANGDAVSHQLLKPAGVRGLPGFAKEAPRPIASRIFKRPLSEISSPQLDGFAGAWRGVSADPGETLYPTLGVEVEAPDQLGFGSGMMFRDHFEKINAGPVVAHFHDNIETGWVGQDEIETTTRFENGKLEGVVVDVHTPHVSWPTRSVVRKSFELKDGRLILENERTVYRKRYFYFGPYDTVTEPSRVLRSVYERAAPAKPVRLTSVPEDVAGDYAMEKWPRRGTLSVKAVLTKDGVRLEGEVETVRIFNDRGRATQTAGFSLAQDPKNPWRWEGRTTSYGGFDQDALGRAGGGGGGNRSEPFAVTFDAQGNVATESPNLPELQWAGRRTP